MTVGTRVEFPFFSLRTGQGGMDKHAACYYVMFGLGVAVVGALFAVEIFCIVQESAAQLFHPPPSPPAMPTRASSWLHIRTKYNS